MAGDVSRQNGQKSRSLANFWSQFTPEERSAIMRERGAKSRRNTPAMIKARKKAYKNGQGAKINAGRKKWAEEHPEALYKRGKELSATEESKDALKRGQAKNRRKGQIAEAKRKRAEAALKYQTNLNIKFVDNSVENADDIADFFGEGV